jgi:hypothetical protein
MSAWNACPRCGRSLSGGWCYRCRKFRWFARSVDEEEPRG